jgi:predicted alpha/beta-fold hydrolase
MIFNSDFQPAWWLRNRHAQTIFPNVFRPRAKLALRRERLELPDGDFTDVDWTLRDSGPIVIVLHGLEGSIDSRYAGAIMCELDRLGYRAALLYFRGCSGEPNRHAGSYHSGLTRDLDHFVQLLRERYPGTPLAAIGYSLGGNVLLKWLGERGDDAGVVTGVAVSVPFDLAEAAATVDRGLSRMYQFTLLRQMQRTALRKFQDWPEPPVTPGTIRSLRSFYEFDDMLTAPLNGFHGAADYYERCSSRQFLRMIKRPTLILHAADDPFMSRSGLPGADEIPESVRFELSPRGGHVGFVSGGLPWRPRYWLEERIPAHLSEHLIR